MVLRKVANWYSQIKFLQLIDKLSDDDKSAREYAATSLGNTDNSRAIEPLIKALEEQKEYRLLDGDNTVVRLAILNALVRLGTNTQNPTVIEPLIRACREGNGAIREAAIRALDEIRKVRRADFETTNDTERAWVLALFRQWKRAKGLGNEAVGPLSTFLTHYGESSSLAYLEVEKIANALGEIGDARASDVLCEALQKTSIAHQDKDGRYWKVRLATVSALKKIGTPSIPKVIEILKRLGASTELGTSLGSAGSKQVLYEICDLLVDIGDTETVKVLASMKVTNFPVQENIKSVIEKLKAKIDPKTGLGLN